MIFESFGQEDTEMFGHNLGEQAVAGQVYCLVGDLGAGKTAFVRGFARGLGIDDHITSPTFSIVNEYAGRMSLYHFDVYRIEHVADMEDTGYEEYFYGNGVTLVEWADMIEELLPTDGVVVHIDRDATRGEDFRRIVVEGL